MKYFLILILPVTFGHISFAQKKVRVQMEYYLQMDPMNPKKMKSDLFRKYYFDEIGFANEIVTYGKKSLLVDTINIKRDDGSEETRIIANYPEDMKKIGRVEKFFNNVEQTLSGSGFEIWNTNDTFRFENKYTLESPGVYIVNSTSKIPYASPVYYCDLQFEVLVNEAKSIREYNDYGQITTQRYIADDAQGVIKRGMTKYFKYNADGTLKQDSTVHNGNVQLNNKYFYDKESRIIRQEQIMQRFNKNEINITYYDYNKEGVLDKKYQKKTWSLVYQYLYY